MAAVEIPIHDIATGGDGIGRAADGRVVFVPGAVPGDVVRVQVVEDRPRLLRAVLAGEDAVVTAGPGRRTPPCPHALEGCGGCDWQHLDPPTQSRLRVRTVTESRRRLGGWSEPDPPIATVALADRGFRTTVRVLVADGRPAFRAARSHDAVPIASCLVAHPGIDELLRMGRFGDATEATLRIGARTGERLVVLHPRVAGAVAFPDDVVVVGADALEGPDVATITEVVHGRRFRISAGSFFQTRPDGAEALVDAVAAAADGALGRGTFVDLYGGVGLFSACLAEGMDTVLVESSPSSIRDARANLADRSATIVQSTVARWSPVAADVVVADPPRAGLGRPAVDRIVGTGARRLVTVHCDGASYGRDVGLLTSAGYSLVSTTSVELFAHTHHVELVSRFDRIDP